MDLFEPLIIKLTLPNKYAQHRKIGNNNVHKLLFREVKIEAQVVQSNISGFFKLITKLQPPFDCLYLKKSEGKRGACNGIFSLRAKTDFTLENWDSDPCCQFRTVKLGRF